MNFPFLPSTISIPKGQIIVIENKLFLYLDFALLPTFKEQ